jgi:hypothetical protein
MKIKITGIKITAHEYLPPEKAVNAAISFKARKGKFRCEGIVNTTIYTFLEKESIISNLYGLIVSEVLYQYKAWKDMQRKEAALTKHLPWLKDLEGKEIPPEYILAEELDR